MPMDWTRLRQLWHLAGGTCVAYTRMGATVVIAVVIRLCMDCVGIILTGQEPAAVGFWFAHCKTARGGFCVLEGFLVFFVALLGASFFAWSCQEWLMDPERNPYSRRYSFAIIIDAAAWVPISVVVGKTNALVEWCMGIVEDDLVQALLSSAIAAALTLFCALLSHCAMVHCHAVQESERTKEKGFAGFFKFFLLATLYSLGWAVAWSNWELVLALMDALDPGRSVHNSVLAAAVISFFCFLSTCFYLRYGPEPIIPDPKLQRLCYINGYSSSLRRSLVSYGVYSCVVFMVMCFCDPTYGILISLANLVYSSVASVFDAIAFLVLAVFALVVTLLAALLSALLSWVMQVDGCSSMRLSRSVHWARQEMVTHQRSRYRALLAQVLVDGSDARLAEAGRRSSQSGRAEVAGGDEAGGPPARQSGGPHRAPDFLDLDGQEPTAELESERQLRLSSPGMISSALCASVLVYDVLGLVVCSVWGSITLRGYSVLLGHLAAIHNALYALTCVGYALGVVVLTSRLVFVYAPSRAEAECRGPPCGLEGDERPLLRDEEGLEFVELSARAGDAAA